MRNAVALGVAVVMLCLVGSAEAANSLQQGAMALSIGVGDSALNHVADPTGKDQQTPVVDISGRYFLEPDVALTAGMGFQVNTGDLDGTYWSFNVGVRKYLREQDFAPFIGGQFSYISYNASLPYPVGTYADYKAYEFDGIVGFEYFFANQVSIEGSVGLAFGHGTNNASNASTTYLGTRSFGIMANFYF
jgi:hypothetical protein